MQPATAEAARAFFEENFRPVRIARLGEAQGFLTGYYEPIVQGSRFPNPEFHVPLYRRPRDLVAAGHKGGTDAFPNKGAQIGRRNENSEIVPYHDRGAIEAGALDGQKLEICWLRDPFEALAIQIQGSARVILEDGTPLRINYDSHNGFPYTAVGRVLIERNLVPREEMSMQRIRDWMAANPDEAPKLRATNRSYVFFRITGLSNDGEPVGAQGIPLMPGRSIAVDKIHVYGTPFFIEATLPVESAKPTTPFRRLMIAQDTGSAIVGPARADLYWGAGDDAARIAGRIRHPGRFVMLLPRELDMVEAGSHMPLPVAKPKIPDTEIRKEQVHAKPEAGRGEDDIRDAESAPACRPLPMAVAVMTADDVKPRRRRLTAEEHTLWSRITRSVAPLRRQPVPAAATPVPSPPGKTKPAPSLRPQPPSRVKRRLRSLRRGSSRSTGGSSNGLRAEASRSRRASTSTAARKTRHTPCIASFSAQGAGRRRQVCPCHHRQRRTRARRMERARRAQAPGAAVAEAAGISRLCRRLRARPCRPWRGGRTLRANQEAGRQTPEDRSLRSSAACRRFSAGRYQRVTTTVVPQPTRL